MKPSELRQIIREEIQNVLNENIKYLCTNDIKIGNRFYKAGNDVITDEIYNSLNDEQKENFMVFPSYLEKMIKNRKNKYNSSNNVNKDNSQPWDYTFNINDI